MIGFDKILSLIAPASCITCGIDGSPLCADCYLKLSDEQDCINKCLFCNKETPTSLCRICNKRTGISEVLSLGEHKNKLKKLIWELKFNSSRANIECLASYLKLKLRELEDENVIFIPAPTAPKRARSRGYDQAKLLAKSLVKLEDNWVYKDLLIRNNDSDQIGLSKLDRKQRTRELFLLEPSPGLRSNYKIAVLVDDVVTTGSTIQAAARALEPLKFNSVIVVCLSHKPLESAD